MNDELNRIVNMLKVKLCNFFSFFLFFSSLFSIFFFVYTFCVCIDTLASNCNWSKYNNNNNTQSKFYQTNYQIGIQSNSIK